MSISEGDTVITPDGEVVTFYDLYRAMKDGSCPDRQREDEDELTHEISHLNCPVCYYCGNVITGDEWSEPCSARQPAEDDDELEEWVNRRASLSDFELSDAEVQNVVEFIRKNDDEVDFFSLDKEEANERLDKLIVVEATAGMLNDLSEEERKRYKEASKRRPLFDEDDDDGEGDFRELAKKAWRIGRKCARHKHSMNKYAGGYCNDDDGCIPKIEQAIRAHCELSDSKIEWPVCHYCEPEGKTEPIMESEQAVTIHQYHLEELSDEDDGVCEWTLRRDDGILKSFAGCRDNEPWPNDWPEKFNGCPFCMKPITTDEGGFEVGDVVRITTSDMEGQYELIIGYVNDDPYRYKVVDKKGETSHEFPNLNPEKYLEKVGTFAPDDDALERVNPEAKGELLVLGNKGVFFWPFIESGSVYVAWNEMGEAVNLQPHEVTRTGIVIDFHQIAEE